MAQRRDQPGRRQPVICLAPGQRLLVLPERGGHGLGPLGEDAPGPAPLAEASGPGLYAPGLGGASGRTDQAPRGFFLDRYVF